MHMHGSVLLPSKAPCGLEHATLRETGILLIWLDATQQFMGEKLCIFSSGCHVNFTILCRQSDGMSGWAELFRHALKFSDILPFISAISGSFKRHWKIMSKNNAAKYCRLTLCNAPFSSSWSLRLLSNPSGSLKRAARSFRQCHITMTKSLPRLEEKENVHAENFFHVNDTQMAPSITTRALILTPPHPPRTLQPPTGISFP